MEIIDKEASEVRNGMIINSLPCIRDGLRRLGKVFYWPEVSGDDPDFKALSEFVVFKVAVKRPFFDELFRIFRDRVGDLCQILQETLPEDTPQMNYEEAYYLLLQIGINQTRELLRKDPCLSSKYQEIVESINDKNLEEFKSILRGLDIKRIMQVLWEIRFILSEVNDYVKPLIKLGKAPLHDYYRQRSGANVSSLIWFDSPNYSYTEYFYNYRQESEDDPSEEECENQFVEYQVKGWPKRIPRKKSQIKRDYNIEKYIKMQYSSVDGESISSLGDLDGMTRIKTIDKKSITDVERIAEELAHFLLFRNVMSHSGREDELDRDLEKVDCGALRDYILLYIHEMLNIYNKVKNILDDDDKEILDRIISRSEYIVLFKKNLFVPQSSQEQNSTLQKDEDKGIYFPQLPDKKINKEAFCNVFVRNCKEKNPKKIRYFFWGMDYDDSVMEKITSSDPIQWLGSTILFFAFIHYPYSSRLPNVSQLVNKAFRDSKGNPMPYPKTRSVEYASMTKMIEKEIEEEVKRLKSSDKGK